MSPEAADFSGSRAILIGTSVYEAGLDPIRAAEHSLTSMRRLLTGPLCGWPADRVTVKHNVPRGRLLRELAQLIKATSGTLVIYYVGHGLRTLDGDLCLALTDTDDLPEIYGETGIQHSWLRGLLRDCRAEVKVLILDCCFSGVAVQGVQAGAADQLLWPVQGAYTLTASHASLPARHETEGQHPRTHFTKQLVELVLEGIPGAPSYLTLDDIFPHLRDRLVGLGLPEPQSAARGTGSKFVLARNAAPERTRHDPELELTRLRAENLELRAQLEAAQSVLLDRSRDLALRAWGDLPDGVAPDPPRTALASEKVVVVGGFGSGKSTFIATVSEIGVFGTEEEMTAAGLPFDDLTGIEDKSTVTTARDYGRVTLSDTLSVHLFAPPGSERFWFMWDDLMAGAFVCVLLVDVRRIADSFPAVDYLERRGLPFVVAVNEFDSAPGYPAEAVRESLALSSPAPPILTCDARVRSSVRAVLGAAIAYAEDRPRQTAPATAAEPEAPSVTARTVTGKVPLEPATATEPEVPRLVADRTPASPATAA